MKNSKIFKVSTKELEKITDMFGGDKREQATKALLQKWLRKGDYKNYYLNSIHLNGRHFADMRMLSKELGLSEPNKKEIIQTNVYGTIGSIDICCHSWLKDEIYLRFKLIGDSNE